MSYDCLDSQGLCLNLIFKFYLLRSLGTGRNDLMSWDFSKKFFHVCYSVLLVLATITHVFGLIINLINGKCISIGCSRPAPRSPKFMMFSWKSLKTWKLGQKNRPIYVERNKKIIILCENTSILVNKVVFWYKWVNIPLQKGVWGSTGGSNNLAFPW